MQPQFIRIEDSGHLPSRAYPDDAGLDLAINQTIAVYPGELTYIKTGIAAHIEPGFYYRLVGRSSTSRRGLQVIEGIIDAGYTGELLIGVRNLGDAGQLLVNGNRVAQLLLCRVEYTGTPSWCDEPPIETARGARGFGSSDDTPPA